MADETKIYEIDFFRWFKDRLKDKGLQFSQCGFKLGQSLGSRHDISLQTGFWMEPTYSANKPSRWLYQIEPDGAGWKAVNPAGGALNIGAINASQEDKAGVVFRLVPLVQQEMNDYFRGDSLEVHALFVFHGATPQGSSAEPFHFNPNNGVMKFKGAALPYLLAGLLGVQARDHEVEVSIAGTSRNLTYGEVIDALAADITAAPEGAAAGPIPVYDLSDKAEFERLKRDILGAWEAAGPVTPPAAVASSGLDDDDDEAADDDEIVAPASLHIPEMSDLLGIDAAVYRQINAALASGKQHIMLYGPPGTGKTTLARHIATVLTGGKWTLVTGSSDWSSQDIIGGYQPVGSGSVAFIPGVLLRRFDRPLIIDELNRCDIDKVIGPLFTVLSGQQTTLPYRVDIEDKDSLQYVILPETKPSAAAHEFAPGPHWRLVATINSIDKASLYQMSYALARRFGWVYVDAPRDTAGFMEAYLRKEDPTWTGPAAGAPCPLASFWAEINRVRVIGPAPIIDAIKAVQAMEEDASFFAAPTPSMRDALLDAVDMVLLPMLDGIVVQEAETLAGKAIEVFGLDADQSARIKARMAAVAV
ncbi:AAA family ATPase [Thioclava sp.]|uniref:AAA family ATPase n=1 Tax=Thioclava sp. TaxID=1933450 RepID=UPI003242F965